VGSHATVASMLDEVATMPGVKGIMGCDSTLWGIC
jgi:hypothetical protein